MAKMELTERERAAQNAYLREWRRKNPDKVQRYKKNYLNRLADRMEAEATGTAAANGNR